MAVLKTGVCDDVLDGCVMDLLELKAAGLIASDIQDFKCFVFFSYTNNVH